MASVVPASVKIKRTKVKNIDTDRLMRRVDWLIYWLREWHREDQGVGRIEFGYRAAELWTIEQELVKREVPSVRWLTHSPREEGSHL